MWLAGRRPATDRKAGLAVSRGTSTRLAGVAPSRRRTCGGSADAVPSTARRLAVDGTASNGRCGGGYRHTRLCPSARTPVAPEPRLWGVGGAACRPRLERATMAAWPQALGGWASLGRAPDGGRLAVACRCRRPTFHVERRPGAAGHARLVPSRRAATAPTLRAPPAGPGARDRAKPPLEPRHTGHARRSTHSGLLGHPRSRSRVAGSPAHQVPPSRGSAARHTHRFLPTFPRARPGRCRALLAGTGLRVDRQPPRQACSYPACFGGLRGLGLRPASPVPAEGPEDGPAASSCTDGAAGIRFGISPRLPPGRPR